MSLKLGSHLFTGPFGIDATEIRANQAPVVYAIIAKGGRSWAPVFRVVDIGGSPEQGVRFVDHPCRAQWVGVPGESLGLYLFDTRRSEYSAAEREQLVQKLRRLYDPPRGIIG